MKKKVKFVDSRDEIVRGDDLQVFCETIGGSTYYHLRFLVSGGIASKNTSLGDKIERALEAIPTVSNVFIHSRDKFNVYFASAYTDDEARGSVERAISACLIEHVKSVDPTPLAIQNFIDGIRSVKIDFQDFLGMWAQEIFNAPQTRFAAYMAVFLGLTKLITEPIGYIFKSLGWG
jgi:hypothetical protein